MTKALLVILRHGETEYNKQHLMTGQRDVPLTERGKNQARAAGTLVSHIRFDKAYSSTLSRAFNTAALVLESSAAQTHLLNADGTWQIEQRKEIIELDTGDFTGLNHKTDPKVVVWKRTFDRPLPNGESQKQVVARVQDFFDNEVMPRLLKGENVLVVVHAGVVRAFDFVLGTDSAGNEVSGIPRKKIPNATPTVYEYEDGALTGYFPLENPQEPANENTPPATKKKHMPD